MAEPDLAVQPPSLLADQVFASLRTAIANGELPAGARLRVRDLAARAGTSVMPVREAIRRLEEAGMAVRVPHRGAVVRGLTHDELLHVYDVRLHLEVPAAEQGCRHVDPGTVELMWQTHGRMRDAAADGRLGDALDEDEELLRTLYSRTGNQVLLELIEGLWRRCRPYKLLGAAEARRNDDDSLWSHQSALVAAAAAGDGAAAAGITRASLLGARRRVEASLAAAR
ncbi:GntR family transcriptional regulator [Modestobacter lapidis]|nr:GntR family transcriptional regulator [Modestobacter lapidis]